MSDLADYEARIIGALLSIPDLMALRVKPCMWPDDAFLLNHSKQPEIYVCHLSSQKTGPGVANTRQQIGRDQWAICCVSTSYADPTAAQSQTGGIFELVEAIRKVQSISIGPLGGRNEFLMWQTDTKAQAPSRSVTGGGSVGYISEYHAPQRFF